MYLLVSNSYLLGGVVIVYIAAAAPHALVVVEIGFLVVMHALFGVMLVVVLGTAWLKPYFLEVVVQRI